VGFGLRMTGFGSNSCHKRPESESYLIILQIPKYFMIKLLNGYISYFYFNITNMTFRFKKKVQSVLNKYGPNATCTKNWI